MGVTILSEETSEVTKEILSSIIKERRRQDRKWGEQNHNSDHWMAVIGEEFGEVCKAVVNGDAYMAKQEAIEVAACAIAFIECIKRGKCKY